MTKILPSAVRWCALSRYWVERCTSLLSVTFHLVPSWLIFSAAANKLFFMCFIIENWMLRLNGTLSNGRFYRCILRRFPPFSLETLILLQEGRVTAALTYIFPVSVSACYGCSRDVHETTILN